MMWNSLGRLLSRLVHRKKCRNYSMKATEIIRQNHEALQIYLVLVRATLFRVNTFEHEHHYPIDSQSSKEKRFFTNEFDRSSRSSMLDPTLKNIVKINSFNLLSKLKALPLIKELYGGQGIRYMSYCLINSTSFRVGVIYVYTLVVPISTDTDFWKRVQWSAVGV